MIKIEKSLSAIPISLVPAFIDLFPANSSIPLICNNTHQKRMTIINSGSYNDSYNDRYKSSDIRDALINIYKRKCAFCEQRVEQYHIEHYRPKNIYYWLAFSWDNLMLACPTCNQHKGKNFDLDGSKIFFLNNEENIRNINNSIAYYDLIEIPKMVNPEITNPLGYIYFNREGKIQSSNSRFIYTIKTCKLNRKDLNDERRKLLNRFKSYVNGAFLEYNDYNQKIIAFETIVRNFINDSKNDELKFLAFRRYAIASGWLDEIVQEILG